MFNFVLKMINNLKIYHLQHDFCPKLTQNDAGDGWFCQLQQFLGVKKGILRAGDESIFCYDICYLKMTKILNKYKN